jgi:hypothetical protein
MKKILLTIIVVFVIQFAPNQVAAEVNTYSGIWTINGYSGYYVQVYRRDNQLIATQLLPGAWLAFVGSISGTSANLAFVVSSSSSYNTYFRSSYTITFSSSTSATVYVNSCSPSSYCGFQAGQTFTVVKLV